MNRIPSKFLTRLCSALLALGFAGGALAYAGPVAGLRATLDYGARFSASRNDWQLFDHDGRRLRVLADPDCGNAAQPPAGLWLLTRDGDGALELLAPSALALPAGHSGHVALLACEAPTRRDNDQALRVPAAVLAWLADNAGAVHVAR